MPTVIPSGDLAAVRLQSVALFNETKRLPSFRNNMIGRAPTQGQAERKEKDQTLSDYPFVEISDLASSAGDEVTVDLFNVLKGRPTMGDRKLAGRMMSLTHDSMAIRIDQCRGGVEAGGRMTRKRTKHNLRTLARAKIANWNNRLEDQLCLVHVAGARGYQDDEEWVVPLESDPEFSEILVNPVLPPTRNRRFFSADADSVDALEAADVLTLGDIDRMRAIIDDSPFPMQGIRLRDKKGMIDPDADENLLYVLYVSGRVWHHLQTAVGDGTWRTFLQNAHARSAGFDHPLFKGQPGLWNGILVKKMSRAIRFGAGDDVLEYDANDVAQTVQAAVPTDRCILMGAQALGIAYGKHEQSGYHYSWHEELEDHNNIREISTASMSGKAKIRFTGSDGSITDHGVMTLDVSAPIVS